MRIEPLIASAAVTTHGLNHTGVLVQLCNNYDCADAQLQRCLEREKHHLQIKKKKTDRCFHLKPRLWMFPFTFQVRIVQSFDESLLPPPSKYMWINAGRVFCLPSVSTPVFTALLFFFKPAVCTTTDVSLQQPEVNGRII